MITELYTSLITKVASILDSNNKPLFKNVYVFNDDYRRMLDPKKTGTWLTPSCFIEMTYNKAINVGRGLNGIDITYTFHIIHQQLNAPPSYTINGVNNNTNLSMDQNLYIFKLRDSLHKTIQGFTPIAEAGPLRYVTEKQSYNHSNLYEYKIMYQDHVFDTTAYDTGMTASVGLSFSQNYIV